jgi:hypothetical protein
MLAIMGTKGKIFLKKGTSKKNRVLLYGYLEAVLLPNFLGCRAYG